MQVTYELQLADWRASDRFFATRQKLSLSARGTIWFYRLILASLLLPAVVAPLRYLDSPEFRTAWKTTGVASFWPLGVALIPIVVLAVVWLGAPLLQNRAFRESPFYKKQFTLSVEAEGLRGERLTPWTAIHSIEDSPTHIFIVIEQGVIIIPKGAFETDFAATQFLAKCREQQQKT